MIILLLIAGLVFVYMLLYKIELLAILFFTLTIADINIEVPGIPMKIRAVLGIVLFVRVLLEAKSPEYPSFFTFKPAVLLISFIGYFFLLSWGRGTLDIDITKLLLLTLISTYCAYFFYCRYRDYSVLKFSIILSALICFSDLVYTYMVQGQFPVTRVIDGIMGINVEENMEYARTNHNFYGSICGIGYAVILNDFLHKKWHFKLEFLLMPVFLLGILMSTSRSSILGFVIVTSILLYNALKNPETSKRGYQILTIASVSVFVVIVGFFAAQTFLNLDSKFIDEISFRLIEEPIAVFKKNLGLQYNIHDLDALDWRGVSAEIAFNVFLNLPPLEQILGVGYGGYLENNMGRNHLNPHNGFLLLLIEGGIAGLLLYIYLVGTEMWKSIQMFRFSSSFLALIFMIIYCIGQNEELTSAMTFIFIISMASETYTREFTNKYESESRMLTLAK